MSAVYMYCRLLPVRLARRVSRSRSVRLRQILPASAAPPCWSPGCDPSGAAHDPPAPDQRRVTLGSLSVTLGSESGHSRVRVGSDLSQTGCIEAGDGTDNWISHSEGAEHADITENMKSLGGIVRLQASNKVDGHDCGRGNISEA